MIQRRQRVADDSQRDATLFFFKFFTLHKSPMMDFLFYNFNETPLQPEWRAASMKHSRARGGERVRPFLLKTLQQLRNLRESSVVYGHSRN